METAAQETIRESKQETTTATFQKWIEIIPHPKIKITGAYLSRIAEGIYQAIVNTDQRWYGYHILASAIVELKFHDKESGLQETILKITPPRADNTFRFLMFRYRQSKAASLEAA